MQLTGIGFTVVSLDIWMTLIKSHPDYKASRAVAIREALGFSSERDEEILRVMREVDRALDRQSNIDGKQYGPYERLRGIVETLGVTRDLAWYEGLMVSINDVWAKFPPVLLEPNLVTSLRTLKDAGHQLVLTSNTGFIDGPSSRLGMAASGVDATLIDHFVFSDEVGASKPDPAMFARVCELSGVEPGSVMHIGDNYVADYRGASDFGMQALYYGRHDDPSVISIGSIAEFVSTL